MKARAARFSPALCALVFVLGGSGAAWGADDRSPTADATAPVLTLPDPIVVEPQDVSGGFVSFFVSA
jgi:hypothetical protein